MTRRGLGRGLSALIAASEDWGEGVTQISVEAIVPNPDQPRRGIAEESLAELAASIREHGVLQPLIVEPLPDGSYRLIAGERRWRAARLAGLATVPAIVREVNEEQRIELALVENVQREDINPVEEAMAYRALMERFGLTQEQWRRGLGRAALRWRTRCVCCRSRPKSWNRLRPVLSRRACSRIADGAREHD